ncbi:hypothetical protein CK203_042223 [Vitis vinifera]|uniref:Uncharacterized protein n=1 Tax=Vitis vinifera TaxID=29760 RepID=A0A438HPY3_VITVI|nr:hypothetical protein CK203_042223 [Vitis vinifera]
MLLLLGVASLMCRTDSVVFELPGSPEIHPARSALLDTWMPSCLSIWEVHLGYMAYYRSRRDLRILVGLCTYPHSRDVCRGDDLFTIVMTIPQWSLSGVIQSITAFITRSRDIVFASQVTVLAIFIEMSFQCSRMFGCDCLTIRDSSVDCSNNLSRLTEFLSDLSDGLKAMRHATLGHTPSLSLSDLLRTFSPFNLFLDLCESLYWGIPLSLGHPPTVTLFRAPLLSVYLGHPPPLVFTTMDFHPWTFEIITTIDFLLWAFQIHHMDFHPWAFEIITTIDFHLWAFQLFHHHGFHLWAFLLYHHRRVIAPSVRIPWYCILPSWFCIRPRFSSLHYPVLIVYSSRSPHRAISFGRILVRLESLCSSASLSEFAFHYYPYGGLLGSSVEFTSFHSLFTLTFHSNSPIPYTRELYQEGHICRPPFRHGSLFLYLFLQITFLASRTLTRGGTFWREVSQAIRWLQKEWDRKGGCNRDRWEGKSGKRRSRKLRTKERRVVGKSPGHRAEKEISRVCCVLCPILTSIFHRNSLDVGPMDETMKWVVIPISSLKLAGIRHPPPHPFFSHSFSIPLPHLHGVSRVHAILHSFTYSLKPLTQASTSMQPTKPVSLSKLSPTCGSSLKKCHVALSPLDTQTAPCDTWHRSFHPDGNSHSFHPGISHLKFFPPTFHPDVLHPESSPPTFYPDISHSEFFPADIPFGYRPSGILLRQHFTRVSHIRNSSPPTIHSDISHAEFFPTDIPSGYRPSEILLR